MCQVVQCCYQLTYVLAHLVVRSFIPCIPAQGSSSAIREQEEELRPARGTDEDEQAAADQPVDTPPNLAAYNGKYADEGFFGAFKAVRTWGSKTENRNKARNIDIDIVMIH